MRRAPPEERFEEPPLFAYAQSTPSRHAAQGDPASGFLSVSHETAGGVDPMQAARDRGAIGAERAAAHAERIESGWREVALLAIKAFAERTPSFQAEDVRLTVPPEADPRAVGALFLEAKRRCWIRPDGYAPSASSNSSPKVRWKSLIYAAGTSPAAQP